MKNEASDIIEQTLNFWGKRTGREFTREEGREMVSNVSGFFQILAEWDRNARMEACPKTSEEVNGAFEPHNRNDMEGVE